MSAEEGLVPDAWHVASEGGCPFCESDSVTRKESLDDYSEVVCGSVYFGYQCANASCGRDFVLVADLARVGWWNEAGDWCFANKEYPNGVRDEDA